MYIYSIHMLVKKIGFIFPRVLGWSWNILKTHDPIVILVQTPTRWDPYQLVIGYLVCGWTNPSEKYAPQTGFIFPNVRDENKKILVKPPPSYKSWIHLYRL